MKRTPICPQLSRIPQLYHPLLEGCPVFDSSCSADARVFFLDREGGLFLKTAAKGTLREEAEITRFFHEKGLGTEVLSYLTADADWLLTRRIPGEDCTHSDYTSDPVRLCDTLAQQLRLLHEQDTVGCPIPDRTLRYLHTARQGYLSGHFEPELFEPHWQFASAQAALEEVQRNAGFLRSDVLLHGDYCLPNIMLDNWKFSGFLDLGNGGIGDRHIDLLWGAWTLFFNLHTDIYRERFLDAYGRDVVEPDCLRTVAALEVLRG